MSVLRHLPPKLLSGCDALFPLFTATANAPAPTIASTPMTSTWLSPLGSENLAGLPETYP